LTHTIANHTRGQIVRNFAKFWHFMQALQIQNEVHLTPKTSSDEGCMSSQNLVYFGYHLRETGETMTPSNLGRENVLNHPACAAAPREKYVRDWILGYKLELTTQTSTPSMFCSGKKCENLSTDQ